MTGVKMSEAEWQGQVVDAARTFGWLDWHHLRSKGTRAGLPDLELIHRHHPRHIRVELKTVGGHLTADQQTTLDLLTQAGVECHVWRPSDFDVALLVLRTPSPLNVPTLWRRCRTTEIARMPPRHRPTERPAT